MTRLLKRSLIALILCLPLAAQAASGKVPYSPEAKDAALAKGCAVFLEFGASW